MSTLPLPFTELEFFQAVHDRYAEARPANVPQERDKPRISGITDDARVIAYTMANAPKSNPSRERPDRVYDSFTTEEGRIAEDISAAGLSQMGLPLAGRQMCIGHEACDGESQAVLPDYPLTGHPDGEFSASDLWPGLRVGWEHKHFGRFTYKELARDGIWTPKGASVLAQGALYGHAMGWDRVLIMVISQDASSTRFEFKQKWARGLDLHPKGQFWLVDMEELLPLVDRLHERARWFSDYYRSGGDPGAVKWETPCPADWRDATATNVFPWGYTEYEDRAVEDGEGHIEAPPALPAFLRKK